MNGHHYIDITKETLDTNSNTVKYNFLNNNSSDHHLDNKKTYILWLNKLRSIFQMPKSYTFSLFLN